MERSLFILSAMQLAALLTYRWVGKVFISQPTFNHPGIFHNPVARWLLSYGPFVGMSVLVVLAFIFTQSPWLFLLFSVAGFAAFSARPYSGF